MKTRRGNHITSRVEHSFNRVRWNHEGDFCANGCLHLFRVEVFLKVIIGTGRRCIILPEIVFITSLVCATFDVFPLKWTKLDTLAKVTLKRRTDTIHVCCVADKVWGRGISQCRAFLELISAPARSIISLGHRVYDFWLLQWTISGRISCEVNVSFVCN